MILGDHLDKTAADIAEDRKILDQIEKAALIADSPDQSIKRNNTCLALAVDFFPLVEVAPL